MHDLLDIYSKLLIATITMLVPILIFYINHVAEAKKIKDQSYKDQMDALRQKSQLDNTDTQKFTEQLSTLHSEVSKIKSQNAKDFKLLNPLRQLKRIYAFLFCTLIFLLLAVCIENKLFSPEQFWLFICFMVISTSFFVIAGAIIFKVISVAIESKN